jgi:limonene-1,2-epoxide hydrolase
LVARPPGRPMTRARSYGIRGAWLDASWSQHGGSLPLKGLRRAATWSTLGSMTDPITRREALIRAIDAFLTGNVSLCERVFTADVVCTSPIVATSSRDELETWLSSRVDGLANIELVLDHVMDDESCAVAEWRVGADHARPFVVPEDRRLDPRNERMALRGVSVADFTGIRISAIRHYFDKEALLAQLLPQ